MRIYYDQRGRRRGYSMSGTEAYAADWLKLIGYFILAAVALFIAIFAAIPALVTWIVWKSKWSVKFAEGAKVLITTVAWIAGVVAVVVVLSNAGSTPSGCIDPANLPSDYLNSNDPGNCPGIDLPRQACIVTTSDDPANGTGNCGFGTKPHYFRN